MLAVKNGCAVVKKHLAVAYEERLRRHEERLTALMGCPMRGEVRLRHAPQ